MKEISIKIDDELYRRASSKVGDLEAEVNQHVTEYLETLNGDDDATSDARSHMADLFHGNQELWGGHKTLARRDA